MQPQLHDFGESCPQWLRAGNAVIVDCHSPGSSRFALEKRWICEPVPVAANCRCGSAMKNQQEPECPWPRTSRGAKPVQKNLNNYLQKVFAVKMEGRLSGARFEEHPAHLP